MVHMVHEEDAGAGSGCAGRRLVLPPRGILREAVGNGERREFHRPIDVVHRRVFSQSGSRIVGRWSKRRCCKGECRD